MQCKKISDLVMKYFDGEATPDEIELIKKHNRECAHCAEEFEMLKNALLAVEELPELEVPDNFEQKVMEKIRLQEAKALKVKFPAIWLMAIVGIMIFEFSMLSNVFMPMIRESGVMASLYNSFMYNFAMMVNFFKDAFIAMSMGISKVLIFRNILLRDYLTLTELMIVFIMAANLYLVKTLKTQQQ